jgi:hypothetical protein
LVKVEKGASGDDWMKKAEPGEYLLLGDGHIRRANER